MKRISPNMALGAIAGIIFLLGVLYFPRPAASPATPTAALPSSDDAKDAPAVPAAPRAAAPRGRATVLSPKTGQSWAIGDLNQISWDMKAGHRSGAVGGAYLIDTQTKAVAGWILTGIAPGQTTIRWNTRDLFTRRGSPVTRDAVPGTYAVVVTFDGLVPDATSAPFAIVPRGGAAIPIHAVTIRERAFSPNTLAIRRGDTVFFANDDAVSHQIGYLSYPLAVIEPGARFELATAFLVPGEYDFYSFSYPSAKLRLTVR